jgi:hypothetical protein
VIWNIISVTRDVEAHEAEIRNSFNLLDKLLAAGLFIFLSCSVKLVHPTSVQTDKDISKKFPG